MRTDFDKIVFTLGGHGNYKRTNFCIIFTLGRSGGPESTDF